MDKKGDMTMNIMTLLLQKVGNWDPMVCSYMIRAGPHSKNQVNLED